MANLIRQMFTEVFGNDLDKFEKGVDEFFDEVYKDVAVPSFMLSKGSYPKVNILEKEEGYKIIAALPGMTKEDIEVKYKDNMLYITGKSKNDKVNTGEKYIYRELKKSNFVRSFRVDSNKIDTKKFKCTFVDGELEIDIPKLVNQEKDESISIKID